ncbi:putative Ig domain-containing protein [Tunicatimonas pelagia]|uniref:putative Ig domain-containing protein n=1 Tax=Tunicatimonas pelagia TaxID=931531 RepID=UPI0026668AEF|nr:putative Ig domain-containing protein [Tunicatimonas pelagia]WKN46143.1 putative Ig domain-containing protein [Tunicatimonas pelagia]
MESQSKTKNLYLAILIFIIACSSGQKPDNQEIDYLGQEAPGDVPGVFGSEIVSVKERFDMGFTMSPDGKSIAFGVFHENDSTETAIYLMHFVSGEWIAPRKNFLPDNINTFFPMFSPTGNKLYFAKSTDGSPTDLWVADYSNNQVTNPQPLDSIFNSTSREAGHGVSASGAFYFTSNRDDQYQCCGDVYHAEAGSEGYDTVQKVDELSSVEDEESLFLSPEGDYIIIQSWRNEFESKHDLYISFKTKAGAWTTLERLNSRINSKEIEQRPFVSPDNKFLFFSRMSVTQVDSAENYDSDIYWVSTKSIFKPYLYNDNIDVDIEHGEPFQLDLPKDLFRDVDDTKLSYQASLADDAELPEWIKFDTGNLSLSGTWKSEEPLIIKITATDSAVNNGYYRFQLDST